MVRLDTGRGVTNRLEIAVEKARLRCKTLKLRKNLPSNVRKKASCTISQYANDLNLGTCEIVAGFWPIRDEIDPRPLMKVIRGLGYRIALPVVGEKEIVFREYFLSLPLVNAGYGTMGPDHSQPEVHPDALLVPLAVFDKSGGRIGYGKGYYDKAISKLRKFGDVKCIGVAFSVQEVKKVPMEKHDIHLSVILTENGVLNCEKG